MDNPGLCLLLFTVLTALATGLAMVCLEIDNMSGGRIRTLEEINRKLWERLDALYPFRDEWVIAGRILAVIAGCGALAAAAIWAAGTLKAGEPHTILWHPLAIFAGIYYFLELASCSMSTVASARVLIFFIPVFKVCSHLLFPLAFPIYFITKAVAKRRIANSDESQVPSVEDEIISLVESEAEPDDPGAPDLQEDEKRMILGALELDDVSVRRIMTPRVDVTGVELQDNMTPEQFVATAMDTIVRSGHSRIPVYIGSVDNVVGVVYSKDLLDKNKIRNLDTIIHRNILFIPVSKNIGDLLEEFRQSKVHIAIVVDEYGGTAGIVTFEDVLETLVGDIKDEYDFAEDSMEIRETSPGVFICDARVTVQDINRRLDTEIPEDEDYDTVGGYLSHETGSILQQGESFDTGILNIIVRKADSRRPIELEITKSAPKEEND